MICINQYVKKQNEKKNSFEESYFEINHNQVIKDSLSLSLSLTHTLRLYLSVSLSLSHSHSGMLF